VTTGGRVGIVGVVVGDDELERLVHQTTVAALVSLGSRAINQLLLRQRHQRALGHEPGTLDGTGGGERPARAALALVLDRGDGAIGDPVDGGRHGLVGSVGGSHVLGTQVSVVQHLVAQKLGAELLLLHVGELVHGQLERLLLRVVRLDQFQVGLEVAETHVELIDVVVLQTQNR